MFFPAMLLAFGAQPTPKPPTQLWTVTPFHTSPSNKPLAMAAAPIGSRIVATMEDFSIAVIDASKFQVLKVLGKHPQAAYAVTWSPDGKYIASGDESGRVWVWDAIKWNKIREYRVHTRGLQKLSFNDSDTMLVSTGKDDAIEVYDLTSSSPKAKYQILGKGANFYGGELRPHTNQISTGTLKEGSRLYPITGGDPTISYKGHAGLGVLDTDWNPAGTMFASGGKDNTAILWFPNGQPLRSFKGHTDWITNLKFSPNGKLIATSSGDRNVKVWDVSTGGEIADLADQCAVGSPLCWTADGRYLVTVNVSDQMQINAVNPPQASGLGTQLPAHKAKPKKHGRRH